MTDTFEMHVDQHGQVITLVAQVDYGRLFVAPYGTPAVPPFRHPAWLLIGPVDSLKHDHALGDLHAAYWAAHS